MNIFLVIAAGLSLLAGILHSILGERLILKRMSSDDLPTTVGSGDFVFRVLRIFWHLVSVAWWGFAVLLWVLASHPDEKGIRERW